MMKLFDKLFAKIIRSKNHNDKDDKRDLRYNIYDDNFYSTRYDDTSYAAERILSLTLETLPPISAALDVGCGVGAWLSILKGKGVANIYGVEGPWVKQEVLEIVPEELTCCDLSVEFPDLPKSDLAICLEVAEHLPKERADVLVSYLTSHADFVLFSAAIPFQGGGMHINEQWQQYWAEKFENCGFYPLDLIRSKIWADPNIYFWYKQNIFLAVASSRLPEIKYDPFSIISKPLSCVHPGHYLPKFAPRKKNKRRR